MERSNDGTRFEVVRSGAIQRPISASGLSIGEEHRLMILNDLD
jgi:hypothetical protein